ncbi:MAG: MFS transporter [Anaerolineaceae bacterium]|nr:MFS transporter [Anaerolineaceae bacterium]
MKGNFDFLKRREILILGFSSIVSGLGNWITMMAILSLVIFKGDGGVAESSGIFMAGLLPVMIFSPLAGKLADRYNRKVLMMISEFGAGAAIVIIIFTDKLWLIYLSMALQAVFVALMNPARQSALPQLVDDPAELEKVNAFFQQLNSVLKIVAPMFAGFLLTIMNAHQAIIIDIVSFMISVVILWRLPALLPVAVHDRAGVGAGSVGAGLKPAPTDRTGHAQANDRAGINPAPTTTLEPNQNDALGYLWGSVPLRLLFLSSFFTILIIVSFDILGSVYIRDVLDGDESFMGLVIGLIGVGSFVTSIWIVMRKAKANYWRDIAWGNFLLAMLPLCMVLGYFVDDPLWLPVLIVAGAFVGGLGNGLLIIQIMTLLQVTSPGEMLGRLSGYLEFTLIGAQMLSVIILPLLIPGVIETYVYFGGVTIALWLMAFTVQVQSKRILGAAGQVKGSAAVVMEGE